MDVLEQETERMLVGSDGIRESPDESGIYSVKNCSRRSANSGSFLFLMCHLRKYAGSKIFKQLYIFRKHVAAEFQVFFCLIHVMVSKIDRQEGHRIFRWPSVLFCLRKGMDGKIVAETMKALAS